MTKIDANLIANVRVHFKDRTWVEFNNIGDILVFTDSAFKIILEWEEDEQGTRVLREVGYPFQVIDWWDWWLTDKMEVVDGEGNDDGGRGSDTGEHKGDLALVGGRDAGRHGGDVGRPVRQDPRPDEREPKG